MHAVHEAACIQPGIVKLHSLTVRSPKIQGRVCIQSTNMSFYQHLTVDKAPIVYLKHLAVEFFD